jgi:N-acetylneuraminic acid mutarotase
MIVWGGEGSSLFNDGGRYDPVANSWALTGVPVARQAHTAVWTGSEIIVWGGERSGYNSYLNDGGRYNPAANSWTAVPTNTAPAAREWHTAVWTGSEMIIWGGIGSSGCLNDGGRYNPVANCWTAVPTNGGPIARERHTAVWTGTEMIVWGGGSGSSYFNDGGRFNPAANTWVALPPTGAPTVRQSHTAVWSGSEMIVWGGYNGSYLNDGGRYRPTDDNWTVVPTSGAPAARNGHRTVWTGSEMIVWGGLGSSGYFNDGGRYNPTANSWVALPISGAPAARSVHTAVWTGGEMIVWGGTDFSSQHSYYFNDGGRYNPAANSWTAVPTGGGPAARCYHTAVWTGSAMVLFGGQGDSGYLSDTWSYYPYAPAVRITRSSPTSADVAWPVWSSTLRLCQTTNLAAGQWTTVTNAVTQVGSENHVTVSPLSGGQFFRAQYP